MPVLISVIIPVYNVKTYVEECLESVVNQSYSHLEIIVVDDGSTDGSDCLCDTYAQRDGRIRVYHKPNGGLSDARNYGIDQATGDYLYFIDSDDYLLHKDTFSILLREMEESQADIVFASYQEFTDGEEVDSVTGHFYKKEHFTPEEACQTLYDYEHYQSNLLVAWNKLYRASLFETIRFPVGKLHEDEFTTYKLFLQAQHILYLHLPTYAYRQRMGSITHSDYRLERLHAVEAIEERLALFEEKGLAIQRAGYSYVILLARHAYLLGKNGYNQEKKEIRQKMKDYLPKIFWQVRMKYKIRLLVASCLNTLYFTYIERTQ